MVRKNLSSYNFLNIVIPIFIGTISFFTILNTEILNPLNVNWLFRGDMLQSYLGWIFYKNSPWMLPLGANPAYGIDLNNSIVMSSSLPIMAIFFKLFAPLLPTHFQYYGIWLLACMILQSIAAWKITDLISHNILFKSFAILLFIFCPPLLFRAGLHIDLCAHFLILFALYLILQDNRLTNKSLFIYWILLLCISLLVHFYLYFIVFCLWLSQLCKSFIAKTQQFNCKFIIKIILTFIAIFLVAWQAGYFVVGGDFIGGGYGKWRFNLLSIIDSNGWSYLLNNLPSVDGDYEGFAFVGSGVILLMIWAFPIVISTKIKNNIKQYIPLIVILFIMFIFSVTNNIYFAKYTFSFAIPDYLCNFFSTLRAAGRLFWPIFYILLFITLLYIKIGYKLKIAIVLLIISSLIQCFDTRKGWASMKHLEAKSNPDIVMQDNFWKIAPQKYKNLRTIPNHSGEFPWESLGYYAATNSMATDRVYLARVNGKYVRERRKINHQMLQNLNFDNNTLYIINKNIFESLKDKINTKEHFLGNIDGFYVLAPKFNIKNDYSFQQE